jgi:hypothetical protein
MDPAVLRRLEELRAEHAIGTRRLEELSREFDRTREAVVRISGAIQVLEELIAPDAPLVGGDGPPGRVGAGPISG